MVCWRMRAARGGFGCTKCERSRGDGGQREIGHAGGRGRGVGGILKEGRRRGVRGLLERFCWSQSRWRDSSSASNLRLRAPPSSVTQAAAACLQRRGGSTGQAASERRRASEDGLQTTYSTLTHRMCGWMYVHGRWEGEYSQRVAALRLGESSSAGNREVVDYHWEACSLLLATAQVPAQ